MKFPKTRNTIEAGLRVYHHHDFRLHRNQVIFGEYGVCRE